MGSGNYLPSKEIASSYVMFYVDKTYDSLEDELLDNILAYLPDRFSESKEEWADRRTRIVAKSGLLNVMIADNEGSIAVIVAPILDRETNLPEFPNIFKRSMNNVAVGLAQALINIGYDIYKRTSAWTSGKILKGEQVL